MKVHLINPSHVSFGTAVITPRWLYVLAAATPKSYGDPILVDETLAAIDPARIQPGDVVGIGIHTANALRGYEIGRMARDREAYVVFGGIHATLYPEEARELGGAHAVVKGDGDVVWSTALAAAADSILAASGKANSSSTLMCCLYNGVAKFLDLSIGQRPIERYCAPSRSTSVCDGAAQ
jgi:hypothetical protein